MSYDELRDLKDIYETYLEVHGLDFEKNGLFKTSNGQSFVKFDSVEREMMLFKAYAELIHDFNTGYKVFNDDNLKESKCMYTNDDKAIGCQGWNGDSGGGIFDRSGNLMGIATGGTPVIGDTNVPHAELEVFENLLF